MIVGASSSIGLTLIPELLNKYRTVVLTEQRSEYSEFLQQVEKWEMQYPHNHIIYMALDVLNRDDIFDFEVFLHKESIKVDSFIYLAGVNMLISALEMTENDWNRIMDVNLKGFFFTSQVIAKNMILNHGGSILGIASQHGVVANVNRSAYCASKAGMIHLAKELALEWAKYNIRVNVVSPTFIISGKNKDLLESAHSKKEYLGKIPLKKYARPQDISAAITFLESGEADMITGQNLILDGGWTIS